MAEPGDHKAAPAGDRGRLRASDADREQVIEVLKDAFVQGRLTRHELDSRAGQAFASRTYAELAAVAMVLFVVVHAMATSSQQRRSREQLPPRPGQGGQAPEGLRPGQAGHDPALPGDRSDQARADLRTDRSRPSRPHPSGLAAWAPRGIRPVPGAV
jgi:hypothetical protein